MCKLFNILSSWQITLFYDFNINELNDKIKKYYQISIASIHEVVIGEQGIIREVEFYNLFLLNNFKLTIFCAKYSCSINIWHSDLNVNLTFIVNIVVI